MKTFTMKNCGCIWHNEERLIRKSNKSFYCPEHTKNGVARVDIKCIDCCKLVEDINKPYKTIRCEGCNHELRKKRHREYNDQDYIKNRRKEIRKPPVEKVVKQAPFDASLYTKGLSMYLPQKDEVCV